MFLQFGRSLNWRKELARIIIKSILTSCNYGNLNLSHRGDDFWNFGALGISPVNQVQFVRKLYENKLPFQGSI